MDNATDGIWPRRNDICDTCTFGSFGKFRGDDYTTDAANAPWTWDDSDDDEVFAGAMITDPAHMVDVHLNGTTLNSMSHVYATNTYSTHKIQILYVVSNANRDSFGGKSDIYVRVTAPGSPAGINDVLDARAFKKNNAPIGT